MNCPKCHGTGWIWLRTKIPPIYGWFEPCFNLDCHAGQVSCAEGEKRDEAAVP